jgi:hypothetical protein
MHLGISVMDCTGQGSSQRVLTAAPSCSAGIRQLDLDLRRFEQELATDPKFKESLDKLRCDHGGAKVGSGRKKKTTNVADLDVEVDPNEPLYCICRRVSFGEMIACDNDDCPIEWFHYECVGFKDAQKIPNSWRCPKCMNK